MGMKGAAELMWKMEGKQIIPKQYPDSGGDVTKLVAVLIPNLHRQQISLN